MNRWMGRSENAGEHTGGSCSISSQNNRTWLLRDGAGQRQRGRKWWRRQQERNEREREEEVPFLLTLLLGSSALHASPPSGRPGGRAGHRRPSSPSPFWSRWRSKQEGRGGARNDAVQRCLKDPLAATFCTTSEERRGEGRKAPPPELRGGANRLCATPPPSGRLLPLMDTDVSSNALVPRIATTKQGRRRPRGVPADAPPSGSAVATPSSEQHRGGRQDKDPFSRAVTLRRHTQPTGMNGAFFSGHGGDHTRR